MDTVEVLVTGIHGRENNGIIILTGRVRHAEAPAGVLFSTQETNVSGILGALAAGESPTVDVPVTRLIGL